MQPNTRCQEKKASNWSPRACWSLVSAAHSLCLGRDSGGLKDFAGKVRRCTFRWREQTAAFLFCHLTFWWGDVSPAAGAGRRGRRSGVCRGMWSRGLFFFFFFLWREGELQSERARVVRSVLRGALASLWNSELGTAAASRRCSRGHSPVLLCLPNHRDSFSPSSARP